MDKINFEPIGKAMEAFDTDKNDIERRGQIENPNGTTGYTTLDAQEEVPCYLSFENIDNPGLNIAETQPINKVIIINCSVTVDLQNGDYITEYKLVNDRYVLEKYNGVIGELSHQ